MVLMGTDGDDRYAWLQAGRALGRVLLHATAAGLAASPLTQALDWPATRTRLQSRLSLVGHPQMLLRMGYPPEAPTGAVSGRRPVEEVLSFGPRLTGRLISPCAASGAAQGSSSSRPPRLAPDGCRAAASSASSRSAVPLGLLGPGALALLAPGRSGRRPRPRPSAARGRRRPPPARSAGRTPPPARCRPRRGRRVTPARKNTVAAVPTRPSSASVVPSASERGRTA